MTALIEMKRLTEREGGIKKRKKEREKKKANIKKYLP